MTESAWGMTSGSILLKHKIIFNASNLGNRNSKKLKYFTVLTIPSIKRCFRAPFGNIYNEIMLKISPSWLYALCFWRTILLRLSYIYLLKQNMVLVSLFWITYNELNLLFRYKFGSILFSVFYILRVNINPLWSALYKWVRLLGSRSL